MVKTIHMGGGQGEEGLRLIAAWWSITLNGRGGVAICCNDVALYGAQYNGKPYPSTTLRL